MKSSAGFGEFRNCIPGGWSVWSSAQSHCDRGTVGRAREAMLAASPSAGSMSNLLPETDRKRKRKHSKIQHRNKRTQSRKLLVTLELTVYEYDSWAADDRELLICSYQCWIFMPVKSHSCHSWQSQPLTRGQCHTVTAGGCLKKKNTTEMYITTAV